jgi:hypothetical protein
LPRLKLPASTPGMQRPIKVRVSKWPGIRQLWPQPHLMLRCSVSDSESPEIEEVA